jgi:glycosidase
MAPIVSNHDSFAGDRLWDQVGGNLAQYKLAQASYHLLPGHPFIYYGEEVGMSAGAGLSGDPRLRSPMSWTASGGFSTATPYRAAAANVATQNVAAQLGDPNSLLAWTKTLLGLRNTLPSIAHGDYTTPFVSGQALGYQRHFGSERTLVVINYGLADAAVSAPSLPARVHLVPVWPSDAATVTVDASGHAAMTLPAQSLRVYRVQP